MIKAISTAEVFGSADAAWLIGQYAEECSIPLIGTIDPEPAQYAAMEHAGILKCFGAFDGERLIGFGTVLTTVLPHYSQKVATVESLFLSPEHREGGTGNDLLEAIERYAEESGCVAILYSAPAAGRFEKLLSSKKDIKRTNAIFCKSLRPQQVPVIQRNAIVPSATLRPSLPPTEREMLAKIVRAQEACMKRKQVPIKTDHIIHAGMYSRTVNLPPGTVVIGTLIKRATQVITVGSAFVLVGKDWAEVDGYQVLPGSAARKQVFVSRGPFIVTMLFPTSAKTVEEAEREMTDEVDLLLSRRQDFNTELITGE